MNAPVNIRRLSTADADFEPQFQRVLHWSAETDAAIEDRVAQIVDEVRTRGDAALRSRYSMPFFLHFRPDFLITPLPECIDAADAAPPPEPITAHDFLMQRLREINLA
jgi:histidinol dehydrogenase